MLTRLKHRQQESKLRKHQSCLPKITNKKMCVVESSGGDCFDSTLLEGDQDDGFSQNPSFSMEEEDDEEAYPYDQNSPEQAAMDMELNLDQCYNTNSDGNNGRFVVQELGLERKAKDQAQSDWEEMGFSQYHQSAAEMPNGHHQQNLHTPLPDSTPYPPTPALLSMFSLPSSLLPNPSISFSNTYPESSSFLGLSGDLPTSPASTVVCGPSMFPLSLPPQTELFHSLPHAFGGSSSSSLFDEVDERDQVLNNVAFYQDAVNERAFANGVFEFSADMNALGKNREGKDSKHFATEKQRRVHFNDKFQALRKLIPNPTKVLLCSTPL